MGSLLIHGDAVEELQKLRKISRPFDVIIADPPYNIGKDFGVDSVSMPLGDYVDWVLGWLADCFDLLADDGLIYLYGFPEIVARIASNFPIDGQRWLVWHYTNKTVPSLKFWQRSHETILCLWKPGHPRPDLEIDQIREPYTKSYLNAAGKIRRGTPSRFGSSGKTTIYKAHKNGAQPRDVIKEPALAGGRGRSERWFMCRTCGNRVFPPSELEEHRTHDTFKHPTQKPMSLTRRLLQSRINGSGGRVLIPFAGSGSECVVSRQLGADFVAIEQNADYVDFATKWLQITDVSLDT